MKINTRQEKDVTVVKLTGDLRIGVGDVDFRRAVKQLLGQGSRKILIDMAGVKSMDSSGLGELVRSKTAAATAGATIKLLHVEGKVHRSLTSSQLIGVFETYDDEIDAIQSFG